MYVVIFRAVAKNLDAEYSQTANQLRELAMTEFNCIAFKAITEGTDEIALSYWKNLDDIKRWKAHPTHIKAQQLGRERWYESYSVQIAEVGREYKFG
jgi:heme-degrading monooxygenase HmoA